MYRQLHPNTRRNTQGVDEHRDMQVGLFGRRQSPDYAEFAKPLKADYTEKKPERTSLLKEDGTLANMKLINN